MCSRTDEDKITLAVELLMELAAQPQTRDSVLRKWQVQRGLGTGADGGSRRQRPERLSALGLK